MLALRRGVVLSAGDPAGPMQELEVRLGPERRPALADVALVGPAGTGDEVVVNVAAVDLGLGSGGYDLVHVNLTRGLRAEGELGAHVMKLNYTSLQHAVHPVEAVTPPAAALATAPVAVAFLHGQLAPLAWAFHEAAPGARLGYVQTAGGALPGPLSDVVRDLRRRDLLAGHLTAGPAYGGADGDAITTAGALAHGFTDLHWHAAVCGPGPGILGSGTRLGHGGMVALESAHTAAALGCPVVVAPRRSSADPRPRHRGLSHHAATMLRLALVPLVVATAGEAPEPDVAHHDWRRGDADLDGYAASGLPARTMGRSIAEDPAFFAAALAAGSVLAGIMRAA
ncbi:MAG TPA: DUF3866 family protein [Solirubrobacteraceae bacterium]|nr:DUF3866 family protein [Solirubrobacteraceae bacterium]